MPASSFSSSWRWSDVALLIAPLALGIGVTGLLTPKEFRQCGPKSPLQPPGWAFGVAWSVLYAIAGVALALAWRDSGRNPRSFGFVALCVALLVMMAWWVVFSNVCMPRAAFASLVAVLVLVASTAELLRRRGSRRSAALLLPLIAWLCFACVLASHAAFKSK
jgi:tryptophan-rich sensory protein